MTHALRINGSEITAKHRENIAASLAHRLEVARAANNDYLVALLEREQQQLKGSAAASSILLNLANKLTMLWQECKEAIAQSSQLSVEKVADETGAIWWRAYDPRTGKTLYADNESEVISWIEANHIGS
ncbi:MAG TPA: hypothetical protein V6C88_11480 [Chroococcidiopsis sp.]